MATTKHILKKTRNECVVLAAADGAGTVTIDIDVDLKLDDETVTTPVVHVQGVEGSCGGTGAVITRSGSVICADGGNGFSVYLYGCDIEPAADIAIAFNAAGTVVVKLKKISGFGWSGFNGPEV